MRCDCAIFTCVPFLPSLHVRCSMAAVRESASAPIYFPVALDVNFAVTLAAVTRRSLALAALLREAAY
jgi:hypothetical protein